MKSEAGASSALAPAFLAGLLCLAPAPSLARAADLEGPLERAWAGASAPFDRYAATPSPVEGRGQADAASLFLSAHQVGGDFTALPGVWGPGGVPAGESSGHPRGIGPVSAEKEPGYLTGLLGGLFGAILGPVAFALEMTQALALTPVRMARGAAQGDWLSLLDPARTVKNIALDTFWTAVGVLNSLSAPAWNAFKPEEATDFMYANNRLVFSGGPVGAITHAMGYRGMASSWHDVFLSRESGLTNPGPGGGRSKSNLYRHEFVHNKQCEKSFWDEHTGESYNDFKEWNDADADEYLNW